MGTAQRLGADLAKPDMANLALAFQRGQTLHRLLDWTFAIDAVNIVEINSLDTEPFERGFAGAAHIICAVVDGACVFAGFANDAELGGNLHIRVAVGKETADQLLIVVRAIGVGGIEEVDAQIDGTTQDRQRFRVVAWTVELTHSHAAQTDGGYRKIRPEHSLLHCFAPCLCRLKMVFFFDGKSRQ